MPKEEKWLDRLLQEGQIAYMDDGSYAFFPEAGQGALTEHCLRLLLNRLIELNADWAEQIDSDLSKLQDNAAAAEPTQRCLLGDGGCF